MEILASLKDLEQELWLRFRNDGQIVWRTKTGKTISIKEMDDAHLINTINMLLEQQQKEDELRDAMESYYSNFEY